MVSIVKSPLTLLEGGANLVNDAIGYGKDNLLGPTRTVFGDAVPYAPSSALGRSIEKNGPLGTIGDVVVGTVKSLPLIAQIDAINRNDPYALGASLPNTALFALGSGFPPVGSGVSTLSEFAGGIENINGVGFGVNVRRYSYTPEGQVFSQALGDSCVAGACKIKISDIGLNVPEAYLRADVGYVSGQGASFRNIPDALAIPENGGLKANFSRDSLRLSELRDSIDANGSAIANVNGHAVVVDSIKNGIVNIRDPLQGAYSVSARDFLRAFNNNNRVAITFGK